MHNGMAGSPSPFSPVSPEAAHIAHLFIGVLILATAIFSIVAGLVVYVVVRYRSSRSPGLPEKRFGDPKLEAVWTALPLLIVTLLFVFSVLTMRRSDPSHQGRQPDLVVIGHQWWWELRYPGSGVLAANEVHMPTGQDWLVEVGSADVIHDFWVPQLGRKIDAVPGHRNFIWLRSDRPDVYLGTCAEYCGTQHAWMRIRVVAEPPDQFQEWQAAQRSDPPHATSGDAHKGEQLFLGSTCVNCHRVAGTAAQGRVGPDLSHLSGRQTLGAGRLDNTPEHLIQWLTDPQKLKPGVHMPDMHLPKDEVRALAAYLETLR